MKVRRLELPLVEHPAVAFPLYHHQALVLDEWENRSSFLIVTKTGTGKTTAAVLPLLLRRERAICVYPTNELLRDQVNNIKALAEKQGLRVCVLEPHTPKEEFARADAVLVHLDAAALDAWQREKRWANRRVALKNLLLADKEVKIVLTNPDILFLLFALRYSAEAFGAIQAFPNVVIDEFHLYQGVELAHALYMVHLARSFGMFRRVVLLSATPCPDVLDHLGSLLDPLVVTTDSRSRWPSCAARLATHDVEIVPAPRGADVVEAAVGVIRKLKDVLYALRAESRSPAYLPGIVVVNSVIDAIRLEDRLVEEGIPREMITPVRGLMSPEVRRRRGGSVLAVGTSAIEVGIDYDCDHLVFEAGEAASFMQRFGRVGRHKPGTAYVLCPSNVRAGMENAPPELDRGQFEERIYHWYPSAESRAWFVRTYGGMVTVCAVAMNILERVREDLKATPGLLAEVRAHLDDTLRRYARILGDERFYERVRRRYARAEAGDPACRWLKVYQGLSTFRTSMPTECVLDYAEKDRRGEGVPPWYEADVTTLLRRAEGLRYEEKRHHPRGGMGMLTVKGYGRYKKVTVVPSFSADTWGIPQITTDFPELLFLQENHQTSVSHVMRLREHIFMTVPKSVAELVDWRLPVFECGEGLVAFDGAALLLREVWERNSGSSLEAAGR